MLQRCLLTRKTLNFPFLRCAVYNQPFLWHSTYNNAQRDLSKQIRNGDVRTVTNLFFHHENKNLLTVDHFDIAALNKTNKDHYFLYDLYSRSKELQIVPNTRFIKTLLHTAPNQEQLCFIVASLTENTATSVTSITTIINTFAMRGMSSSIMDIFELLEERNVIIDVFLHNLLLKSLSKEKRYADLKVALERMKRSGIQPDAYTYNTLISAYAQANQFDTAYHFLMELSKAENDIHESTGSYFPFISNLSAAGHQDTIIKLLENASFAHSKHVNKSLLFHHALNQFLDDKNLTKAWTVFHMARKYDCCDVITYTRFLTYFIKQKDESSSGMNELLRLLVEDHIQPDKFLYTCLLSYYYHQKLFPPFVNVVSECFAQGLALDWKAYRYILNFHFEVADYASLRSLLLQDKSSHSTVLSQCYNRFISQLCSQGKEKEVFSLVQQMKEQKIPLAVKSFLPLVCLHISKNNLKDMVPILIEMALVQGEQGITLVDKENIDAVKEMFANQPLGVMQSTMATMRTLSISFSIPFYTSLMHGRPFSVKFYKIARTEMEKDNLSPTMAWYETLVILFCNNGMVDIFMHSVMKEMEASGLRPSLAICRKLIRQFSSQRGCGAYLLKLKEIMSQNPLSIDTELWKLMINALMKQNLQVEAEKMVQFLVEKGVKPDVEVYNCLLRGYAILKETSACFELFAAMRLDNIEPNIFSFTSVLEHLIHIKHTKGIEKLNVEMERSGFVPSEVLETLRKNNKMR